MILTLMLRGVDMISVKDMKSAKEVEIRKEYNSEGEVVMISVRVTYYRLEGFYSGPYTPSLTVTARTWRKEEGWADPDITIEKDVTFKYCVFNTFTKLIQETVEELEKVIKEVETNEDEESITSVA